MNDQNSTEVHWSKSSQSERWDNRFLDLAGLVASWSKDPGTSVGAVIVDDNNRVISLGFNGLPRGVEDDPNRLLDRDVKLALTIHAEANAMAFANRDLSECTLYVTHPPCSNCACLIAQHGIKRVVYKAPSEGFLSRWGSNLMLSREVLSESGVQVQEV